MPIRKELETIADLEAGAQVIPVGSDLYRQGDTSSACYIVLNGWIALSVLLDDGSCQILDFALPGAVLGLHSRPGAPMYHSAHCLSIVRVYAFPRRKHDDAKSEVEWNVGVQRLYSGARTETVQLHRGQGPLRPRYANF